MQRQHSSDEGEEDAIDYWNALPLELWQCSIWPQCDPAQRVRSTSVCKTWHRLLYATIEHFSPAVLPYNARMFQCFTMVYLRQFTSLRSFCLDMSTMCPNGGPSVLALAPHLRTLTFVRSCPGKGFPKCPSVAALTQLTALDTRPVFVADITDVPTNLTMLRVGRHSFHFQCQLPTLINLTYLELCNTRIYAGILTPLTHMRALTTRYCPYESYDFLASLPALVFLDLECSGCETPASRLPLAQMTSLTALSLPPNSNLATETIVAKTQLRVLGVTRGFSGYTGFSIESLDVDVMAQLRHLDALFYYVHHNGFDDDVVPGEVAQFNLTTGVVFSQALARFTQWHHALPCDFFNTDRVLPPRFVKD